MSVAEAAMSDRILEPFSAGEEVAHALTHGLGALLSVVALVAMVLRAAGSGVAWAEPAALVFGLSLVTLYTASTLYHGIPWPRAKRLFQLCDHVAIYYLIAGTYTPFTIVTLGGTLGWSCCGLLWAIALGGTVFELVTNGQRPKIALALYLAMGWIAVFFINDMAALLPSQGLWLVVAGGISYTVGAAFYAWTRLPYNHVMWHLFVLGGSAAHVLCIYDYVLI